MELDADGIANIVGWERKEFNLFVIVHDRNVFNASASLGIRAFFVLDFINNHVAGVHGARIYKIVIPEFDHEKPPAPVCYGKKISNKKSNL